MVILHDAAFFRSNRCFRRSVTKIRADPSFLLLYLFFYYTCQILPVDPVVPTRIKISVAPGYFTKNASAIATHRSVIKPSALSFKKYRFEQFPLFGIKTERRSFLSNRSYHKPDRKSRCRGKIGSYLQKNRTLLSFSLRYGIFNTA